VPRKATDKLRSDQLRGAKYLGRVLPLLRKLHDDGTARDKAGNRELFYDQYAALVLLSMFSPALDSLRAIRQATALPKARKLLGCSRCSLGSLSEAARVFDPGLLKQVVAELGGELASELAPVAKDVRLKDVRHTLVLADGTLLKALPRLVESAWKTSRTGTPMHGWRMHTQFDLGLCAPSDVELTDYRNSGASDEREVLKANLRPGRCYVMDRGYFAYWLFDAVVAAGSDYVCRVKKSLAFEVTGERAVSPAAREAGVVRDSLVRAGDGRTKGPRGIRTTSHPVRLVWVQVQVAPRAARGTAKPQGPPRTEVLILATNLLDVPAEVVALVYKYRWTVELFFRFFKQVLGCRHLISDDPRGVAIQCYCAVIACMLLALWTGRKPDKATWRMVHWLLTGWADERDLLAHLSRPDNRGVKLRAKDELWKKLGVN